MKKRYVNGTILKVEDYITSVNFEQHDMDSDYSSIRVYRDLTSNIINVKYNKDSTIKKLPKRMFELIESDDTLLEFTGKIIPEPTVRINGIEYIFSENTYNSISIYLLHEMSELGVNRSKCGVYNNNLYIALLDSDYKSWSIFDYVDFINSSGLIHCHIFDSSLFKISNVYSVPFDNKVYEYNDKSIAGLQREFYVNDVTITADFVRQMRNRYPEIQFYARAEDKDSTKYNEWINYKISPSHLKHNTLFTSHVWEDPFSGRYWKAGLDIEFEYSTNDLPTLMTRRNNFMSGGFLNNDRQFSYIIDDGEGNKDFDIGYTVFWERDSLETDYGKSTSQDDTGYAQFTYKYIGRLGYTNIEDRYSIKPASIVDSVIYTVLYAPPKEDIKTYDDGITLKGTDLDYKTFLEEFYKLSTDFEYNFGVHIEYNPTTMEIETFDKQSSKEKVYDDLNKLMNCLKSINESATKRSNFVMVASLKQVQSLVSQYRDKVMDELAKTNYDFGVEEGDIIGDEEITMTINNANLNKDDEDIVIEDEQDNNEENGEKEDITQDDSDNIEIKEDDEDIITTQGEYIPSKDKPTNWGIIL